MPALVLFQEVAVAWGWNLVPFLGSITSQSTLYNLLIVVGCDVVFVSQRGAWKHHTQH